MSIKNKRRLFSSQSLGETIGTRVNPDAHLGQETGDVTEVLCNSLFCQFVLSHTHAAPSHTHKHKFPRTPTPLLS